jgi:hypothetical protein
MAPRGQSAFSATGGRTGPVAGTRGAPGWMARTLTAALDEVTLRWRAA